MVSKLGAGLVVAIAAIAGYELLKKSPTPPVTPQVSITGEIISQGGEIPVSYSNASTSNHILPIPRLSAVLDAEAYSLSGLEPLTVKYTATVSGGVPGTSGYTFDWNWGDNTTDSTGNPATHTYNAAGSYTVKCTVSDSIGNTVSVTDTVTVSSPSLTVSASSTQISSASTLTISLKSNLPSTSVVFYEYLSSIPFTGTNTQTTDSNGSASVSLTNEDTGSWQFWVQVTVAGVVVKSNVVTVSVYAPLSVTISGT